MVTQGILSEATKYFETNTNNQAVQKSSSTSGCFNDVMNNNLKSDKKVDSKSSKTEKSVENPKKDNSIKDDGQTDTVKSNTEDKGKVIKTENEEKTDITQSSASDVKKQDTISDTKLEEDSDKVKNIINQVMNNLSAINDTIKNVLKDTLNISDEQLENIMSQLGMQMSDLLQTNNLKQFVLAVNGTKDMSSFLTNEDLTNQFTKLMNGLENIDFNKEFGVSKEEISAIVESMQQQTQPIAQSDNANASVKSEQSNQDKHVSQATNEPQITVTVQKSNTSDSLQQESLKDSNNNHQETDGETTTTSQMDTFVQNLVNATQQNAEELSPQMDKITQMKEIVNQIVDKIKVVIKPEATSMEIQLNPENLGKVNLSVVSKNGQLTAHFTTETQAAKEALESQLQTLKETLNNQGLKVESVEVNVSNFTFSQSNQPESGTKEQKGASKKHSRLKDLNGLEDVSEEEVLATKVMEQNGGSIDYTA